MVLKKLMALMVALVIANPACCCAFGAHGKETTQASHSCCSAKSSPSEKENKKPCTCASLTEKATPEVDLFKADPTSKQLPPLLTATEILLPKISRPTSLLTKAPPGRLPVPLLGNRLAIHCTYLV